MPTEARIPRYIANVVPRQGRPPDELNDGACRTYIGIRTMDALFDAKVNPMITIARGDARKLCNSCPVIKACDEWVTRAETPAGGWDGMFAGLLPVERARRQTRR